MPLKIYSSSAGSGKTYTLAKEYLKLVLPRRGKSYFRHILAVTFTNKATAEMKERIVKALRDLSTGGEEGLLKSLSEELDMPGEALKVRAGEVLNEVLQGYSDFYISTIDSFFQRVIRAFAKETGLQAGFRVELDEERVLDEVADQLLLRIGTDEMLTGWLVQFVSERVEEGKSWDIKSSIKALARELFRESFKAIEIQVFTEDFGQKISEFRNELVALKAGIESRMKELGNKGLTLIGSFGLEVSDFSYKATGPAGYFAAIAAGRSAKDFEPGARPLKAAEDNTGWYSKDSPFREQIEEAVAAGLYATLSEAVKYWQDNRERYISAAEVLKNLYTFGILQAISAEIRKYRDENDVLLISDTAQLLDTIIAGNDTPFIYEKSGNRFHHFLVDEFQDTSAFQWNNLRPLLVNSLSVNHYSMIVGDVKQSIYRFRGGDWKLLLEKVNEDFSAFSPQRASLDGNWRSRKNIIHFNNAFFQQAALCLKEKFESGLSSLKDNALRQELYSKAAFLEKAYADVAQQVPATGRNEGGYVHIELLKEPESGAEEEEEAPDWKERVAKRLPALVEDLQDKGFMARDIAFLVRTRQEGAVVATVLNEYKNALPAPTGYVYDVVSSESLEMQTSPALTFIMAAISHLYQPQDDIIRAQFLYLYLCICRDETLEESFVHDVLSDAATGELYERYIPRAFAGRKLQLTRLSLFELTEQIITLFGLNRLPGEYIFLQFFQDAVLNFTRESRTDVFSFMEWWEEEGKHKSVIISEEQDAMKIVTLHKSKGLQYGVVIIPYCSWDLETDPRKNNILWCRSEVAPFSRFAFLPLRFSADLKSSLYRKAYYEEILMSYMDNLNLLYVAFTRPVERLYAFAPHSRSSREGTLPLKRIGDLLLQACQASGDTVSLKETDTSLCMQKGEEGELKAARRKEEQKALAFTGFPVNAWSSRIAVSSKAGELFREGGEEASLKINYGILLHKVLSEIGAVTDVEKVVENLFREGMLSEAEKLELKEKLEALFLNKTVQHWFSPAWISRNECEILLPDNTTCRPDKVLIQGDKAVVIDFKTGAEAEQHKKQVTAYAAYISGMGYREVQAYLLYLTDLSIKRVQ
jgi:ATP-dependent helicase/nuclease subunit A